jgi:hypothetical protein
LLKPRKCGQAKEGRNGERDLHTVYIYYTTEKKAGRFERERKREREKRGEKGLLLLVIDFAGTIFSPTRTTDLIICMQTTQCSKGSSSRPIIIWVCVEGYASTLVRIALSL